jgi:hypothetical protein
MTMVPELWSPTINHRPDGAMMNVAGFSPPDA